MIILCDVDGVVADMLPAWLGLYNREFEDSLTVEDITTWELAPHVKPEARKRIYEYLHDPVLYRHTREVPGALQGVRTLAQRGYRLVYLTSCVGPEMMSAKATWLKAHDFLNHGQLITVSHMPMKELIRGDFMIDDYAPNLLGFVPRARLVSLPQERLLFDAPYNRELSSWEAEKFTRVRSWEQIVSVLS